MKLTYVPARQEDVELLFSLARDLVDRYEDKHLIAYDRVLAWMRRKLETNICRYTRVLANGALAGFFFLDREGEQAELDDLYILPPFRRQGIGCQVVTHCLESTPKSVFLYVFKENLPAVRLYEKCGFTATEQVSPTRQIMRRGG